MALLLNYETKSGFKCSESYWKVIETNINWLNRTAHVVLAGWVNAKAKEDGKSPMDTKSYDYTEENFPFDEQELKSEGVSTRTIAYEAIKAPKVEGEVDQNVFSSAVDI